MIAPRDPERGIPHRPLSSRAVPGSRLSDAGRPGKKPGGSHDRRKGSKGAGMARGRLLSAWGQEKAAAQQGTLPAAQSPVLPNNRERPERPLTRSGAALSCLGSPTRVPRRRATLAPGPREHTTNARPGASPMCRTREKPEAWTRRDRTPTPDGGTQGGRRMLEASWDDASMPATVRAETAPGDGLPGAVPTEWLTRGLARPPRSPAARHASSAPPPTGSSAGGSG